MARAGRWCLLWVITPSATSADDATNWHRLLIMVGGISGDFSRDLTINQLNSDKTEFLWCTPPTLSTSSRSDFRFYFHRAFLVSPQPGCLYRFGLVDEDSRQENCLTLL